MNDIAGLGSLDVLARICRLNGWALILSSTGSDRSALRALEVVEPCTDRTGRDLSRKKRIRHGDLVARAVLNSAGDIPQAAATLIDFLSAAGVLLDEAA